MTMDLYCFGESGNAYKAALTLALTGSDWRPVYVDFFNGETRTPAYRALNEMGEVPVLVDGDLVLTQSGVIQAYIADKTGQLGGTDPAERREIWRWVLFDNQKVSGMAGPLRFNMNFLPEAKRNAGANEFLSMRLHSALKILEAHLHGRDWVALDRLSVADLSLCGYLFYDEAFTFERAAYPAINAWLDRIAALPGWKHPYELMPGSPADRI